MGLHTTDVIVLRRYLFRETSVIITCLSDNYGKLKGLVKGLRKQPNRYRSAMEPLTLNRIVFYDTHTSQIHLISQCDLLAPFCQLQRDLDTMRCAAFCVDLVDHLLGLEEKQLAIYQLLRDTLERLALGGRELLLLRIHFVTRLLRLVGFQPQLDECVGCGTQVYPTGYWSPQQGGLLCPSCHHQDPIAEPVSVEVLNGLREISVAEQPITLEPQLLPQLAKRLDAFLQWRLDRPLKTLAT